MISYLYSIPYIVFFLFFTLCFLMERNRVYLFDGYFLNNPNHKLFFFILFVAFSLIIGLRGLIASDWINYKNCFELISTNLFQVPDVNGHNFEIGFQVLMKLCKIIYPNYHFFVLVSSLIDFLLFYHVVKNERSLFLCFLFFYIYSGNTILGLEFNLMRNTKSILIFAVSLKYVRENNFIKYIFLNLVGVLFHTTSWLYMPAYFLLRMRYSRKLLISLFLIGNVIFIFQIKWLSAILCLFVGVIPGRIGYLLNSYLHSNIYASAFGISIGYIERFIVFLFIYYFYGKCDKSRLPYYNCLFIYLLIILFFSEMNIFVTRVAVLFIIGYWFVLPEIYFKLKRTNKKVFLLSFIVYSIIKIFVSQQFIVVKYDNVLFNPIPYEERLENFYKFYQTKDKF